MHLPRLGGCFVWGLAALALATLAGPRVARAAGVVTTCDQAHLHTALSGGGLVTFHCGAAPVTISLTSTEIVSANTIIDGGGLITIEFPAGTVFQVNGTADFTVQNLTISNSAEGIENTGSGAVRATNCTFSANSGYGIFNKGSSGAVTATNCTFSDNGTGIDAAPAGDVTATNCTFSDNTQGIETGGSGTVIATNCTFSDNTQTINTDTGEVTATNCTFFDNFDGIGSRAIPIVTNCILAGSANNCSIPVTDGGHNIDDGNTCGFKGSGCSDTSGSSFCNTDPMLAAGLAYNGGPTQTIAVLAGSPAINAGDEAVCAASPENDRDERGFVRPGPGSVNCTIGAFEFGARPALPSSVPAVPAVGLLGLIGLLGGLGVWKVRQRSQLR